MTFIKLTTIADEQVILPVDNILYVINKKEHRKVVLIDEVAERGLLIKDSIDEIDEKLWWGEERPGQKDNT